MHIINAHRFLGLILAVASAGYSQAGCTLRGEPLDTSSSITSNPGESVTCLDLANIDGQTIRVPANVTQIDYRGLAVCPADTLASVTYPPAIVFILDQSGSMETGGGDPNGQRAIVLRSAISNFYNTAGAGYFSFIEFARDVEVPLNQSTDPAELHFLNNGATTLISQNFLPMNDSIVAVWSGTNSPIQRRTTSGTNYVAALRRAKEYINTLKGDTSKNVGNIAVIFISDGAPSTPAERAIDTILSVLDSSYEVPGKYVPIHGIFLGQNGIALELLANSTNGSYQTVDPAIPNSLGSILDPLVKAIALGGKPTSLGMNLDGIDYSSQGLVLDSLGGYQVRLDRAIPLDSGENLISMDVRYLLENGDTAINSISFTLDVTDAPPDSNSFFVEYCPDPNSVSTASQVVNPDTATTLVFDFRPTRFSESTATLTIISAATDDRETITLPAILDSAGLATYAASLPLQITTGSQTPDDSTLQVTRSDTVFFHWVNPDDPRDSLNWFVVLTPTQGPYATNFSFRVWETDSIGTKIKALSDKSVAQINSTQMVSASRLLPPNLLSRKLIAGTGPDQMNYQLLDGDTAYFTLQGDTLALRRRLDFETNRIHQITYLVSDNNTSDTGVIQIAVLNVNEFGFNNTTYILKDHALQPGEFLTQLTAKDPEGDSITMNPLTSSDGVFSLHGDSLFTESLLPFAVGNVYRVPVEISDGTLTDTIFIEIHMVKSPLAGVDTYLRNATYQSGQLQVETGPGLLEIHSVSGERILSRWIRTDGATSVAVVLEPGLYAITVGCSKRTIVVN